MKKRVMLAMSGGVDSSAALILLKEKYTIIGVTMKLFDSEDILDAASKTCCSLSDIEDAKSVAARFGVDHYTFNFKAGFKENVINRFVASYLNGETPNPCIDCNRFLKFDELLRRARSLECDYLATGHYARIERDEKSGRYILKKALDSEKDQSYVLYNLTQEQLACMLFPLGNMTKAQARELAGQNGLINAKKPDSQDICFVPDGDYAAFVKKHCEKEIPTGRFVDSQGNILGEHRGIVHYTIGQRKGLGIAMGRPVYVTKINPEDNTVILEDEKKLFKKELLANDVNFISIERLTEPLSVKAKTRYRQPEQPCVIFPVGDGTVRVVFDNPQRAITPGQAVVFYDGDTVVGGGRIMKQEN